MILDSHVHAWGPASRGHPWVNTSLLDSICEFDVHSVYTTERLLYDMDSNGIDEAVVVGYPICEWTDNWYTIHAVEKSDRLNGIVMVDPFTPDATEHLRECMAVDGILGFRLGLTCPRNQMWEAFDSCVSWLHDALDEADFWQAAIETDAAVQIFCYREQLDQVQELVGEYPELTYLLDHYACAGSGEPIDSGPTEQLTELAAYDNVAIKISETPHLSSEGFPYYDLHDHIQWILDEFGRERVMWGSDYPNVSDVATYGESRHWLRHVDTLSSADRKWITGRSFKEHVGFE